MDASESDGELARVFKDLMRIHLWFFEKSKSLKIVRRCHLLPNFIILFWFLVEHYKLKSTIFYVHKWGEHIGVRSKALKKCWNIINIPDDILEVFSFFRHSLLDLLDLG